MFCQKCGAEIVEGAFFCKKCGNKVPNVQSFADAIDTGVSKQKTYSDDLTKAIVDFQRGNIASFDTIYNESKKYVYYTILKTVGDKDTADDIMQETYLDVYKSLSQLQNPEVFKIWTARIAQHKISRYFQKKIPNLFSTEEELDDSVGELVEEDTSALPEESMVNKEVQRLISDIINELPENQRSAVISFYYNQMSISEIAEAMEVPENTVKTYLFRGKKKIKDGVLEIEKKHGTKLYALPLAGLLGLLFTEETKAAAVTSTSDQILGASAEAASLATKVNMGSKALYSAAEARSAVTEMTGRFSDISSGSKKSAGSNIIPDASSIRSTKSNTASIMNASFKASGTFLKKLNKKTIVIVIVSLLLGIAVGRSTASVGHETRRNPFVGKWRSQEYGNCITINENNTFVATKADNGAMAAGTWIADDENIKFRENGDFNTTLFNSLGGEIIGKYDPKTDTFRMDFRFIGYSDGIEIYERVED